MPEKTAGARPLGGGEISIEGVAMKKTQLCDILWDFALFYRGLLKAAEKYNISCFGTFKGLVFPVTFNKDASGKIIIGQKIPFPESEREVRKLKIKGFVPLKNCRL
jgi:hypothetical protein